MRKQNYYQVRENVQDGLVILKRDKSVVWYSAGIRRPVRSLPSVVLFAVNTQLRYGTVLFEQLSQLFLGGIQRQVTQKQLMRIAVLNLSTSATFAICDKYSSLINFQY